MEHKYHTSYSFEEMKDCFMQRLIKENRCFRISDSKSNNTFRIDVCAVNPHNTRRSCWQPGIIRKATEDILMRMNINRLWI